jgi:hypothetical protein
MVISYPGTVTKIRAKFDKPGRYVWHCHILSHEDHVRFQYLYIIVQSNILFSLSTFIQEMMRVLHVGEGARDSWPSGKAFGKGLGGGNGNGGGNGGGNGNGLRALWNKDL